MKVYSTAKEIKGFGVTVGHPTTIVKLGGSKDIDSDELFNEIQRHDCKRIEFTGEEPLLNQLELVQLLKRLYAEKYFIELTTNGTMMPDLHIREYVNLWNVHIDLERTGYFDSIMHFATNERAGFMFRYTGNKDLWKIKDFIYAYQIPNNQVTIMPCAKDMKDLTAKMKELAPYCKENGFVLGVDIIEALRLMVPKKGGSKYEYQPKQGYIA